ncbi:CBS domain-containing protein [Streptomyces naphthomycinicus]|uniref:CBS domain-containing protein n=1 Tax=Streptomyces naphthomycinicus TaxID=2872625 RepID=UPI001CED8457|nr:CBS domain-containing protein [Streptomyces sp. TML10]
MDAAPTVVDDVMTHRVVALRAGAAFKDIVKTMWEWRVSALPVLDDAGRVVGVVSEADLLPKEEYRRGGPGRYGQARPGTDAHKAWAVTAGDLMSAPAVTVTADATLAHAARVMARNNVKRLPVVDRAGALKGIVSRADLLKVFLRADEDIAAEVRREVVLRLFGAHDDLGRDSEAIGIEVREGVVTLTGRVCDTDLVPLAVLLTRAVEGVVDVRSALAGPPRRPNLDPDLPDADMPGPDLSRPQRTARA